jgi:hypothetical protein
MQHFLDFLPLPHGQGSLRPTLTLMGGPVTWLRVCERPLSNHWRIHTPNDERI